MWLQGLLSTTHDYHPADVATAELGVGRVVHVCHPAAHEDAQPHHQQVFHLDAREAALEGEENTGEGLGSALGSAGGQGQLLLYKPTSALVKPSGFLT